MKLECINVFKSPDTIGNPSIWVSESENAFYITNQYSVMRLRADESDHPETLFELRDKEEAYAMKGIYDKRLPDDLYDEIRVRGVSGFQLLDKNEYDSIDTNSGSTSYLEEANWTCYL